MSKRKKSKSNRKPQGVYINIHFSATAQEFFLRHEQLKIAEAMFGLASGKPGWAPGRTWSTTLMKSGQRFKAACDNRRDGIYVLVAREHELIHEDAPA